MKKLSSFLYLTLLFVTFTIMLSSCSSEYVPKPTAYPRMVLPDKGYEASTAIECPFTFEQPVYTSLDKDPYTQLRDSNDNCWMNLVFEDMNAQFHLSYKEVQNDQKRLSQLIDDAHKLRAKHMKKADYVDERTIATNEGVYGLFSDIGGNAASQMQFYITDSTEHFMFGSLYFDSTPNYDSIQPAIDFIKADVLHLLNTFEWKEPGVSPPTAQR